MKFKVILLVLRYRLMDFHSSHFYILFIILIFIYQKIFALTEKKVLN